MNADCLGWWPNSLSLCRQFSYGLIKTESYLYWVMLLSQVWLFSSFFRPPDIVSVTGVHLAVSPSAKVRVFLLPIAFPAPASSLDYISTMFGTSLFCFLKAGSSSLAPAYCYLYAPFNDPMVLSTHHLSGGNSQDKSLPTHLIPSFSLFFSKCPSSLPHGKGKHFRFKP